MPRAGLPVAQEEEGASSSLSYSDKATADPDTNMSIGLLSMAPIIVACAGIGGKTARFKVVGLGKTKFYELLRARKIKTITIGGRRLVPADEARRIVREGVRMFSRLSGAFIPKSSFRLNAL